MLMLMLFITKLFAFGNYKRAHALYMPFAFSECQ